MSDKKAEVMFLVVIAETIKDLDGWTGSQHVTARDFLDRVGQKVEESCQRDLDGVEYLELEFRTLYDDLLRSYDLLIDPKAPPRQTKH